MDGTKRQGAMVQSDPARLMESVTCPSGTLHLTYETAGLPTYGDMAIEN